MPYIPAKLCFKDNASKISKTALITGVFCLSWIILVVHYCLQSHWFSTSGDLTAVEFIGGLCGFFMPLVLALLTGAYFYYRQNLQNEVRQLQEYAKELVFPSKAGTVYTQALTTALRHQVQAFKEMMTALQERTDMMRTQLKDWTEDLQTLVQQIDVKNAGAMHEMAEKINQMVSCTQTAVQQADHTSALFQQQADLLQKTIGNSMQAVEGLSKAVAQNLDDMTDRAHAMENMTQRTATALEKAQGVAGMLQNGTRDIEKVIAHYQLTAQEQQGRFLEAVQQTATTFQAHGTLLEQSVSKTIKNLATVEKNFTDSSSALFQNADAGIFRLNEASTLFEKQAGNLKQTLDQLQTAFDNAPLVSPSQDNIEKNKPFLGDAKLVLNQLQSCAVDMAKIFTPKQEEALWNKYYAGDKAVFMRHIAHEISAETSQKVRLLYQQNPVFKLAVSRYMIGFEEMSKTFGEDSLLLSLIIGSDIGRVYMVLADIFKKSVSTN